MEKLVVGLAAVIAIVFVCAAFSSFGGWLAMLCWNALAADVFGAPHLTFIQSWCGMFLLSLVGAKFRSVLSANETSRG